MWSGFCSSLARLWSRLLQGAFPDYNPHGPICALDLWVRIICLLLFLRPLPGLGLLRASAGEKGEEWARGCGRSVALAAVCAPRRKVAETLRGTAPFPGWHSVRAADLASWVRHPAPSFSSTSRPLSLRRSQGGLGEPRPCWPQPGLFSSGLWAAAAVGGRLGAQLPGSALCHAAAVLPHLPHLRAR